VHVLNCPDDDQLHLPASRQSSCDASSVTALVAASSSITDSNIISWLAGRHLLLSVQSVL
jgi:hypothetical protein